MRGLGLVATLLFSTACGGTVSQPTVTPTPRPTRPAAPSTGPLASASGAPTPAPKVSDVEPIGDIEPARVTDITDGDTVRVRIDGREYRVRYIGIDAPERGTEQLARESTLANSDLVDGQQVWLERDVSNTDRNDRLLRHVWLESGDGWLNVSAEIVRLGLADARSYPPDTAWDDLYAGAEAEARAARLGIWGLPRALLDPATPRLTDAPTQRPQ